LRKRKSRLSRSASTILDLRASMPALRNRTPPVSEIHASAVLDGP
jgi:hypothetical protein